MEKSGSTIENQNSESSFSLKPEYFKTFLNKYIGINTNDDIENPSSLHVKRTNLSEGMKEEFSSVNYIVPDKFSYNANDQLSGFSNQFSLENGMNYTYLPNQNKIDNFTVSGKYVVAHHLLDTDLDKATLSKDTFKNSPDTNYYPIIKKDGNNVWLTYKQLKDVTNEDEIASELRQYKLSDIDFDSKTQEPGYRPGHYVLSTKTGIDTQLHFVDKDSYGRHSGNNVVFIFTDKKGNKYARDFSGTINEIKSEGEKIVKRYDIKKDDIILGYMDAGSYSVAEYFDNIETYKNQIKVRNLPGQVGAGLAIPTK